MSNIDKTPRKSDKIQKYSPVIYNKRPTNLKNSKMKYASINVIKKL